MKDAVHSVWMWKTFLTRGAVLGMLMSARVFAAETDTKNIPNPITSTSFPCLVKSLSEAAITIVVPIAVIAIIFAGLKFVIAGSQGNEGEIKKARDMLFWIVMGTAVVVGSFVLAEVGIKLFGGATATLAC